MHAPIKLELLATVFGMQNFDKYVFGNQDGTVHTDHRLPETTFLKPLHAAPKRLQSMLLALPHYPLKVVFRPG